MSTLQQITIPAEFLALARGWYDGQNSMLYALASVGDVKLGTIRPFIDSVGRFATDREWHVQLWMQLSCEVMYAAELAEKTRHRTEGKALRRFEDFADNVVSELAQAYGLDG